MAAGDLPTAIYIFDSQGVAFVSDSASANTHVIANAEVIASLIAEHQTRPPFVPCIVDSKECVVDSKRQVILHINPHPRKGENLAWAIAEAAPELKFVFQESWRLSENRRMEITNRAKQLGNVEFRPITDRSSEIYRDARVLLAPYGPERPRVVDEAQANGIPVIASDVGGLNESVGPGGVLIDPSGSVNEWVSVLKRLESDNVYYEKLASAALLHSKRLELRPEYIVDLFEHELHRAIERLKN
jgi:glycosyltransferase involved in cell wall biosynthesis